LAFRLMKYKDQKNLEELKEVLGYFMHIFRLYLQFLSFDRSL
jgi:hypothetical protein